MTSAETLRSEFETFEANWADLRPFLIQYLPHDKQLVMADRLFTRTKRYLERAMQADDRWQRLVAMWWYTLALTEIRAHDQLVNTLGERGLQAQEEVNRQRKATI